MLQDEDDDDGPPPPAPPEDFFSGFNMAGMDAFDEHQSPTQNDFWAEAEKPR